MTMTKHAIAKLTSGLRYVAYDRASIGKTRRGTKLLTFYKRNRKIAEALVEGDLVILDTNPKFIPPLIEN